MLTNNDRVDSGLFNSKHTNMLKVQEIKCVKKKYVKLKRENKKWGKGCTRECASVKTSRKAETGT